MDLRVLFNLNEMLRWHFVIHGGIDGFSRLIVYMKASNNNRSNTVLQLFKEAVQIWDLPSRVRFALAFNNCSFAASDT